MCDVKTRVSCFVVVCVLWASGAQAQTNLDLIRQLEKTREEKDRPVSKIADQLRKSHDRDLLGLLRAPMERQSRKLAAARLLSERCVKAALDPTLEALAAANARKLKNEPNNDRSLTPPDGNWTYLAEQFGYYVAALESCDLRDHETRLQKVAEIVKLANRSRSEWLDGAILFFVDLLPPIAKENAAILNKFLFDPNLSVSGAVIHKMVTTENDGAIPLLENFVSKVDNPMQMRFGIQALNKLRSTRSIPVLEKLAKRPDLDKEIRDLIAFSIDFLRKQKSSE